MKILFICSKNKWRSLTAERIFDGTNGYDVRSAGTKDDARIKVTKGHIGWADIIFVMEKKHHSFLQAKFGNLLNSKEVIVLHIFDKYRFMDKELIEILTLKVSQYIEL